MKSIAFAALLSGSFATLTFPSSKEEFRVLDNLSMTSLFDRYISHFGKSYNHEEKKKHFEIFQERVLRIFEWNAASNSFTKGINQFTDLDDDMRRLYVMPETPVETVRVIVLPGIVWVNFNITSLVACRGEELAA